MKKILSYISTGVVGAIASTCLWSCAAENPFESEGEGVVRLTTAINSITTRADDTSSDPLRDNCVVYISNEKGLIYKEKGLDNIKESFTLKAGNYVAEAWTGDSVSASFDKKFYRGYEPFEVTKGSTTNVVINCKIANVVASINTETIDKKLIEDYRITVSNSKGELTFDKDNASYEKAFFMMPNGDTTLRYNLVGTYTDGQTFDVTGEIPNVQRAHHYIINFDYKNEDPSQPSTTGAVFVKIKIKDEEFIDNKDKNLNTRPTITSFRYNLEKQLNFINDDDIPEKLDLQICGFKGIKYINLSSASASELGWPSDVVNIAAYNSQAQQILNSGVECNIGDLNPQTNVITATVSFQKSLLEKLSKNKTSEHLITIAVEDEAEPYEATEVNLRIVRNEEAIRYDDPITVDKIDPNKDCMSVTPHSFTISFSLADSYEGIPGVEYSKENEDNWTFVAAGIPSNAPNSAVLKKAPAKQSIVISGLEPATTYKYRAVCGDFHSYDIMKVTTESIFIIPNSSFEDWSTYKASTILGDKDVTLPGNTGNKGTSFWGSGNEGSATANMTLTNKSTDMCHSGSFSARLASAKAVGVLAAGNIFVGEYVKTDGTNGVLSVGREYNGSHPAKLKVHANYRPGTVDIIKKGNESFIEVQKDGKDQGQIYIALTTEPVELRTKPEDRKLFNPEDDCVLAYGEVTWTDNYGPDGDLQEIEIPFTYNKRAETNKPTYLVIVCSASKFGDFFSGSSKSVMYVDDFELIYE